MTTQDIIRSSIKAGAPGLCDLIIDAIVRSAMRKICHDAGVELSEENDRLMETNNRFRAALECCSADWISAPGTVMGAASQLSAEFRRRMEAAAAALTES